MAKTQVSREEMIEKVTRELCQSARADIAFGEPLERNGVTVIPVASAGLGVGGGHSVGRRKSQADGAGGGMRVSPAGYIEVRDDEVRFRRILPTRAFVSITLGLGGIAALLLYRALG